MATFMQSAVEPVIERELTGIHEFGERLARSEMAVW
jgi:hypothetical protein